ncbi:hypothetical protein [Duganella qianjiadongensis]|uniref:Uncharacterized protein n=1 Tax=Duganella qianjiadongensis TaxID=2692176 RepID=A0ABW9VJ74_9BURK|nr:hypothetical protein [Duganella qianjiadongensis]MYM39659.1 hypothetical protein [Duganella qianjiadongensis]
MGLQYYDINIGLTATQEVAAQGRYLYYLSGTTPNVTNNVQGAAGNQAIKVRASSNGNTVILMPGQALRLPHDDKSPERWFVSNYKGLEVITGLVMVGEGEFVDNNTSNLVTLTATAISNAQAMAVQKQALNTITTFAAVTINTGAAQALVSDATQRCLRIRNTHATANLAIGGPTVTLANAAVVIPPGGVWIEEEAAGAAWYATSDTAGTNVTIQGLKL